MKVVLPADTTHNITLIPRFDTVNALTLSLYNEATKVSTTVSNSYLETDGNLVITFDFTFVEKDKYQIKILDGTDVLYRGKLIATTQEPQDYKLTDGRYTY
ncbi:MAG TPA: hypothetical protein VJ945_03465 [Flavobacteriaceae bacterium]|nr:hypothetical protein [Flavobacteriaceae bacterium]